MRRGLPDSTAVRRASVPVVWRSLQALGLAVLLLVIAACATKATPTPTATPVPTATPTPAGTQYPLTITDKLGRPVQVAARPARIVSVHPTATEMLYKAGGVAVGRDTSSRYPPEAQPLPTVGGAYSLSVESLVALQPDLVLIEAVTQARLLESLQRAGAPVVAVRAASLQDVKESLALVGRLIDRRDVAERAAADIEARVTASKAKAPGGKSVLVLISDADRKIYAAKPESYPGEVVKLLNLTNLAAGLPDSGPYPGFALFSGEQAVTAKPDMIFTISPAPAPAPTLSSMLPRVPGYADLDAVKTGRVKEISPELFLQAQGPRIDQAVDQLAVLVSQAAP